MSLDHHSDPAPVGDPADHLLTPQQQQFFDAFGFVRIPQFLEADEVAEICDAFEQVFLEQEPVETFEDMHFGGRRLGIPFFLEHHDRLKALEADPRILGVVRSLVGEHHEYRQTDGNLLFCDTAWHCDIYDSPLDRFHIKLFFYLDPVSRDSGALRVIPGTHDYISGFARTMRRELDPWQEIAERFGVEPHEIPAYTVESEPGDLIVGNFRTVHATFGGAPRRRLFTMNYREVESAL